jgi:nitrogen-specific signal transduction histidine kinase
VTNGERVEGRSMKSSEYKRKLIVASFRARVLSVSMAFLCATLLDRVLKVAVPPEIVTVLFAWLLISLAYLWIFRSKVFLSERVIDNIHFSYYFPGILLSTSLVHYMGGAEWIAFAIYFFDMIHANMLLKRPRARMVTAGVLLCYFTLITLEYAGIMPHHRLIPMFESSYDNLKYVLSTNVLIVGMIFLLITYVTGLFAKIRQDREMDLMMAKEKVEIKAKHLEELSNLLKSREAENELMKSRSSEYIREKEMELNAVKKDMKEQIDTLRKTQKTMRFMIEDLNDMARELKVIKDNLEEKVRERTEELMGISGKLHRSEKLAFLGKLAGSITHELRNPMAVIKNAAYFLETIPKDHDDKKTEEYTGIIKKGIDDMNAIISDVMGFAKTDPIKLEKRDIRKIVEEVIDLVNPPKLIRIKKEFMDVPEVMVDAKKLVHAMANITNNAIVAMKGNGQLVFRVLEKEESVCIEISDTGGGIPEKFRDLIFEPLYSTRPKGTGLGLSIAKMMVEGQNGKISLSSRKGAGTTFTISIPISPEKTAKAND